MDTLGRVAAPDRQLLAEAVRALPAGAGARLWLDADAGMGASTFLDGLCAAVRTRGCRVLRVDARTGRGSPGLPASRPEQTDPPSPAAAAVDPAILDRTLARVERLSRHSPLVVVGENLHAADEASLVGWARLARRAPRTLMLGAARPVPYRPEVRRLREIFRQNGQVMALRPLALEAVAELAAGHLGRPAGERLSAYLATLGGNPRRVVELLDALGAEGVLLRGRTVDIGDEARADAVLAGQLLRPLPGPTRDVLRSAALLGPSFDPAELATATVLPLPRLAARLAPGIEAGLIGAGPDRFSFTHDLIRRAFVAVVPAGHRQEFHDGAAQRHARTGSAPESVAAHLLAGAELSSWAVGWLLEQSEATLVESAPAFVVLLERAVRSLDRAEPRWPELAARYAVALYWVGRDDEAVHWALAVGDTDPTRSTRLRIIAGRACLRQGRPDDAVRLLQAEPNGPPDATREAWLALALVHMGQWAEAARHAGRAGRLAAPAPVEGGTRAVAEAAATHARVRTGDAIALLDRVATVRDGLGADRESRELAGLLEANVIALRLQLGQGDELRTALAKAERRVRELDQRSAVELGAAIAEAYFHLGDWTAALRQPGGGEYGLGAVIALLRVDPDAVDQALAQPPVPGEPWNWLRREVLALRNEEEGQLALALALRLRTLDRSVTVRPARLDGLIDLGRVALAAGRRDLAAAVVRSGRAAATENLPLQRTSLHCVQSLVDDDADGLLAAAGEFGGLGAPRQQGLALEEAAVRLAATGARTAAGAALAGATRAFIVLGSDWDLRRAEQRVRRFGLRPRRAARRPASGWAALSPAERRVARMVAQGLSNPDIAHALLLSRNTVQTHVARILTKLDVSSRREVAPILPPDDPG